MLTLASIRPVKEENSSGLQDLLDTVLKCRETLNTLGRPVANWDDWFLLFASRGMDAVTRREWEKRMTSSDSPVDFAALKSFLQDSIQTLKALEMARGSGPRLNSTRESQGISRKVFTTSQEEPCSVCKKNHYLGRCKEFEHLPTHERRALASQPKVCFNCLRNGHHAQECGSGYRCRRCERRHHSLLHPAEKRHPGSSDADANKGKRPRLLPQPTGPSNQTNT